LINLTAGLMDGDAHLLEITAKEGTRAVVTGQSATRIHPALRSHATQQWSLTVEDDACLVVLPGPVIPFRGSRYYQRARADLAPRARLLWGDIWLPGRYERGVLSEKFQFDKIVQDLEVRRAGQLVYRERFRWDGPWSVEEATWYFGGELATASLLAAGPDPQLAPMGGNGFLRSVFRLGSGEWCFRWCGQPSAVTADLVNTALSLAARWTAGTEAQARPWLIASGSLAPNHWFSTPAG
jgi:urease accessory protein